MTSMLRCEVMDVCHETPLVARVTAVSAVCGQIQAQVIASPGHATASLPAMGRDQRSPRRDQRSPKDTRPVRIGLPRLDCSRDLAGELRHPGFDGVGIAR